MTLNELRALLHSTKGEPPQFTARCPAHDDRANSLSVGLSDDGERLLLHCHAGCSMEDIVDALSLKTSDLFVTKQKSARHSAAQLTYSYRDADGTLLYTKTRVDKPDGTKTFYFTQPNGTKGVNGIKRVPYNLPAVLTAQTVYFVEGEKCADAVIKAGRTATTLDSGANSKWLPEYSKCFNGKTVVIIPDNDEPGMKYAQRIAENLPGATIVQLPGLKPKDDIYDWLRAGHTMDELDALPSAESSDNAGLEWGELIPLECDEELPQFPLDALPEATGEYIYAASESVQAPVDMLGSCVLGVLEIACRGRYPVCLPSGHIERPCLYIAPIAPPSERKSGVIETSTRPAVEFEIEFNQEHSCEVNQNRSELKLLHGKIANAEQRAIKAKKTEERIAAGQELRDFNNELAEFESIEPLRLFGADVTPEKLAAMLKAQNETFALVSAEGGGLFENIGRYSDKGGLEIYLNGYSGDRVCVDRKTSDSIIINRPTLSIIAPCQPSVITDLFSDRQKSGRGLLSRILFIKCPSRVGGRKATVKPIEERIVSNYRNICRAMLASTTNGNLTYDVDGFAVYVKFFDEIEPQLTPDIGELSFMADWAGKLPGQMTRLAGLIHCISAFEQGRDPLDTPINADEATAAVRLARYYLAHAKAVYMEQSEPESITNAKYLWAKIKSLKSIRKRDLIRKTQGKQDFNLDESLALLVERGYIRVESSSTGGAGRPAETIFTNPETENIVTKLTLLSENAYLVNKVNKVTIPATVSSAILTDKPSRDYTDFSLARGTI